MKSLVPNIAVKSIKDTVAYYKENFDFKLQMAVDKDKEINESIMENKEYIWAMIISDDVSLMLQEQNNLKKDVGDFFDDIQASLTLYFHVENIDSLYEKVKDNVEIFKPIYATWYGQKEFYVKDCNGYILCFAGIVDER